MKHTPEDWLLARDRDAAPRLDSIRRAVLAPERATAWEAIVEIFRPNLATWASLAFFWLVLAAAHLAISRGGPPASQAPRHEAGLDSLTAISPDEALSILDHHS